MTTHLRRTGPALRSFPSLASLALVAIVALMVGVALATARAAEPFKSVAATPADNPASTPKHIKLLAVGNSFSGNATKFLKEIVAASGNRITFGHASIGGCPLEKHWKLAEAFEADPNAAGNRPYAGMEPGTKASLKDLLKAEKWDVVTLQQQSIKSFEVETYQPYANSLAAYVRQHAPTAQIYMHQTWAYRADDPLFKGEMTQAKMYDGLRAAYAQTAGEIDAKVLPVGDAFERAGRDPAWTFKYPDPDFDYKTPVFPALPDQTHSLHVGYSWTKPAANGKRTLRLDGHHANVAGQYLGGAVWFECLYGQSVVGNTFVPPGLTKDDVTFLQRIAHEAVKQPACVPVAPAKAEASK